MKKNYIFSAICFISIFFSSCSESFSQMYWNQAASFAGNSSSYISVPNSSLLDITGSFTLEAWVNPATISGSSKGIISKGGALGTSLKYCLRMFNGRILVATNGAQRLISKTTTVLSINVWTHVAATYNASTGLFTLFINGITDTSATVAGATPTTNSDSLFIGISGASTPFNGRLDEVRVWNTNNSNILVLALFKSSVGASGDPFNNLALSLPFQNNTGANPLFSVSDHSDVSNIVTSKNVSAFDLKDRPSKFLQFSDCVSIQSTGVLTGNDHPSLSPTSELTIEFWIFPKLDNYGLLFKGSYSTFQPDYGMRVIDGKLTAYINNTPIPSNDSVKKEIWSHVAFTYFGATGRYEFFINGKPGSSGNITPGNIIDGPDSLALGGYPFVTGFSGFLDEFRITHDLKSISEINSQMFSSINETNDNDAVVNAVYNLDASTLPSTDNAPRLNLRGSIAFNFNTGFFNNFPQSPLNNFTSSNFQSGYYLNMPQKRIPASGSTGTIRDTIEILSSDIITDLNIYVAINHTAENNLRLSITNPLGASAEFYANILLTDSTDNIVTVFDNDADSSLISGRYINFGPKIKPLLDLDAIFSGDNTKGKWILTVVDEIASDTGTLISWGLQFNNKSSLPFNLECSSLVEGFYNSATDLQIADTMRYYLRSAIFPYPVIDSSKAFVNANGNASVLFTRAQQHTNYFLVLKHRNSIETWSSTVIKFSQFTKETQYNFTDLASRAFGNNMKQVDTSPVRFAVFSGDIDQNGFVDLNDITIAFNNASAFLGGYTISDVNGDNITDLSDVLLTFNNSSAFVSKITP